MPLGQCGHNCVISRHSFEELKLKWWPSKRKSTDLVVAPQSVCTGVVFVNWTGRKMPKLPNIWWPASQKNYWERTIFRSGGILGKNSQALIPMCVFKQDYHFSTSVISLHKNLPTETSMNFRNQFRVVKLARRCSHFVILFFSFVISLVSEWTVFRYFGTFSSKNFIEC